MGNLMAALAAIAVAALCAVRIAGVVRAARHDPDATAVEQACSGLLLSARSNPMAGLTGKTGYTAEFLTDGGEKLTLEVRSLPLFRILSPGTRCSIRCRSGVLINYQPEPPVNGPAHTESEKEHRTMSEKKLLKNGDLYGVGVRDILVEGDRILAVGESLSADAEVIDLTGKTVLPGFFNAHVHLYGVHGPLDDDLLRRFVTGGCTTVRDMGMTSELPFEEYTKWLSTRQTPDFPTVINSGKFICGANTYGAIHPSGAKIGYVFDETVEGARAAVDAMVDAGAQQIKTGQDYGMDAEHPLPYLSEEVFRAICQRAKERGVPSSAHITKRDNFVDAAHWGLTEGAHTPTNDLTDEDINEVVRSGMAFNTTASIFDMVSSQTGEQIMDAVISNIGRLYRAGVPMSVGTDFMFEAAPYQTPGIPVHELRLLVKAGLTVEEAVNAATADTANVIGRGTELGSVESGKLADIIAVDAGIDETFDALTPEHVVFVMHRGAVIKQN